MPQKLSEVTLDEVSLVDDPANQKSKVMLVKRHGETEDDVDKKDKDDATCKGKGCAEIEKAPAGVKFVIGFPEEGGSEVQSVIFDSGKWDANAARKWLKDHDMVSEKIDETENTLRFRQKDPSGFQRFRVIQPGKQVSKALKAKDSWQRMQNAVERAVREKFSPKTDANSMGMAMPMGVWVRDFFEDSVIFDKEGGIFRVDYEVEYDDQGELKIKLDNPVPVEVVYQDIKKSVVPDKPELELEGIPEELRRRVLKMRMDLMRAKLRKSNSCHIPSGPKGGQFCGSGGKGSGGGGVGSGGGSQDDHNGGKSNLANNASMKASEASSRAWRGKTPALHSQAATAQRNAARLHTSAARSLERYPAFSDKNTIQHHKTQAKSHLRTAKEHDKRSG